MQWTSDAGSPGLSPVMIHIVQAFFFSFYLVTLVYHRELSVSYRSALFFFIPAKSSTVWKYYNLFGYFPIKKGFLVLGIINNPIELMIRNRIANT